MDYFSKYSSNSLTPSCNQSWFLGDGKTHIGRSFYKITSGGKYGYSFLFMNKIDSTYSDGSYSYANLECDSWEIKSASAYITKEVTNELKEADKTPLYFNGSTSKTVISEEIFYSDEITLDCQENDYICLEIEFSGSGKIPYLEEAITPIYVLENGIWKENKHTPICAMVGCDRKINKKIGFFGDSITEGIGAPHNSYKWWSAQIAKMSSKENSYWNIGIGFGRANDAASDKSWLFKAKQLDLVTVCFGVNDMGQGYSEEKIKENLLKIVKSLKENGTEVILFTIPPFDYDENKNKIWRSINHYIKNQLFKYTTIYDVVPILGMEAPNEHRAKFGGHPDVEGSTLLAQDFVSKIQL